MGALDDCRESGARTDTAAGAEFKDRVGYGSEDADVSNDTVPDPLPCATGVDTLPTASSKLSSTGKGSCGSGVDKDALKDPWSAPDRNADINGDGVAADGDTW